MYAHTHMYVTCVCIVHVPRCILYVLMCICIHIQAHLTAISSFQKDIMSSLPNHYYTFVDVMEFKDLTNEVVISLATSQFHLDIVSTVSLFVCGV